MKEKLQEYVGSHNSPHNKARIKFEAFMNQEKNIRAIFLKQSHQTRNDYRIRLDHNDEIKAVTFKNTLENLKLTSPDIQKDIVSAAAFETINVIINEIGDELFSILVDESHDISIKEQMSIVLRYVNKKGCVVEHFVALVAVANKHVEIEAFFDLVDRVVNVVGGPAKRCDLLREKQRLQILEALNHGEISNGRGLNQQTILKRSGDTPCLCPDDSFSAFDKNKLIRLGEYYPEDFSPIDLLALDDILETYVIDMHTHKNFEGLQGLSDLARKLVAMKKNDVYPLVYKLVTLALILPVATATVERVFSAMKIVKTRLRNRIGDQLLNDSLVMYIENDIFSKIDNDVIMRRYQNMKTRREQL
ncbi:uncharacterized protein LOC127787555 [Diospyros lotus]|uniref:uncharacterized protein LOC127787555 n=1 Tax=Diospyros lotus TaxID=55363 RepID=UPI0022575DC5|nr:uncharacterized protein LOC127787555 [Diospyros lotus]